jgi:polyisoprenoid-binding protein YceI
VTVETGVSALRDGLLTGSWVLDPTNSTISLKAKAMWGVLPVKGTFAATGGSVEVGPDATVTARVEVDAASISTKIRKRDEHLRSKDFLDVATYPTISVAIDRVDLSGTEPTAMGTITVRTTTVPIVLSLAVTSAGPDEVVLHADTVVDRAELGLDFRKQGATKMANLLAVQARFTRS